MASFTFGGFGQQNQTPAQQQQPGQQQQQPTFGGFGTNNAFGTSTPAPAFGQQAQQQTSGLFGSGGGFGSNTTSTPAFGSTNIHTSTPGGLFGGTQNNTSTTPAFGGSSGFSFGARQPTNTGGGLFGSAGQTNTGFGAASNVTNQFGQPQQQQGPPTKPAAHIGAPNQSTDVKQGNDFANPNHLWPTPTNGTADAPLDATNPRRPQVWSDHRKYPDKKDDLASFNAQAADRFEDINALPMYWHTSIEELRVQDYQQGRGKGSGANAQQNVGFGQSSSAFGVSSGGGFGQTNNNTMGGGLFGANRTATTGGGGLFGSAGTGTFGKPATPAFGQSTTGTAGGSIFGNPQQQQPGQTTSAFGNTGATSTFGGFGQNNQQQQQNKPTFGFGQTNTTQPSTGLFGNASTSTSTFGQNNTQQSSGFNFGQNNNSTNTTGGGLFGLQTKPATTGLFGNNNNTATANKPAFSFGQPATTAQPTGGLFGQTNQQQGQQQQPAAGGGLFGLGSNTTSTFGQQNNTAGNTGGSLFGGQNKPAGTGLFGNTSTTGTTAPSFSFGGGQQQQNNNNQQQPGATGGGLFGGGGGSLFGNNNTQNQQQQQPQQQPATGGLFGGTSGGTGLFGNTGNTGGGLFGNLNKPATTTQQQPTSTFNLGQSSFGGFGQSQNNQQQQQPNQSSLLFGQSQQQPQQQQQQQQQQPLQALNLSIDQNPYGNNPIFANVQPARPSEGPRAYDADQPKKQVPLHISYRGTPRSNVKINKLRGFNTSSPGLGASRFGSPATPGTPLHASLTNLGNRAASASPAPLGNGMLDLSLNLPPQAFPSRPSVKKLIIDKKHRENTDFLFGRKGSGTATPTGIEQTPEQSRRISSAFNPDAEASDRPAAPMSRDTSKQGSVSKGKAPAANGNASSEDKKVVDRAAAAPQNGRVLAEGDYYTKPTFKVLQSMPEEELSEVHDFVVGRVGFGEICWLERVDLTGLTSLRELLGEVVVIEDREVMVYPGEYEDEKPEEGQGLNLPAVISLKNCWPLDRATREPIKDGEHPRVKQHIKKLERKDETEFVDYEVSSGTWTFKVAHFSRYGLDSDDEGEGMDTVQTQAVESSPAVQRKKALQQRRSASHSAKKQRRTDSPVSDSTDDDNMLEDDDEEEAPPRITLDDDSPAEEEEDESITERSYSRTPVLRSPSTEAPSNQQADDVSDGSSRRRKRSVVVPTPRVTSKRRLPSADFVQPNQRAPRPQHVSTPPESTQQKPLPARLGLQPKKIAVMQASFFSKPRKDEAIVEDMRPQPRRELRQAIAPQTKQYETQYNQQIAEHPTVPDEQYLPQYKPLREWKPVPLDQSLVHGQEGKNVDFGLAMGRSFRATFGPQGQLVTIGGLQPLGKSSPSPHPSKINISVPRTLEGPLSAERDAAAKALRIQHNFTDLVQEEAGLPYAATLSHLRFQHFADGFHTRDSSEEALLWRLGKALFDEISLGLPGDVTPEVETRVAQLRRRDAFSAWLREAVAASVEQDLKRSPATSTSARGFGTIFSLLTGHQIERACQAALSDGNTRLATVMAQAGGDDEFRADIKTQVSKWREARAEPFIDKDLRKVYEILSGNVNISHGINGSGTTDTSEEIKISQGLDWKRAFAIRFWYADYQSGISQAVAQYDADLKADEELAGPVPAHKLADSQASSWQLADDGSVKDVLYEFIKLYSDYSKPLEDALASRAASSSPFTYRRAWHLYQVISKSLQIRNFEDVDADGFSLLAQQLTLDYAAELERLELWEWSAFILLHLLDSGVREKAIRELLARNIHTLDDNLRSFLTDNLTIPNRYLEEAREMRSLAMGQNDSSAEEFDV